MDFERPNLRQCYIGGRWVDPTVGGRSIGGYKRSGNGREYAEFGLEDYLEIKGIIGHGGGTDGS